MLQQWLQDGHVQSEIANKQKELFEDGLRDWIFHVMLLTGVLKFQMHLESSSMSGWMRPWVIWRALKTFVIKPLSLKTLLILTTTGTADSKNELYHFIGKDIARFHTLFWPAVLDGAG